MSREILSCVILFIKLKTITIFKNMFYGIHMAAIPLNKTLSKGMMDRGSDDSNHRWRDEGMGGRGVMWLLSRTSYCLRWWV